MTAPTGPGPLVELDDLEAFTEADAADLLNERLLGIVDDIRDYCGWHIAPAYTHTLVLDGPGRSVLLLPSLYVTDVETVKEDGRELVEGTDYQWSAKGLLRRTCGVWTNNYRGVEVTLTHGYATLPANIKAVILDAVTTAVDEPAEKIGPFEFKGGNGGVSFSLSQQNVLDRHKVGNGPA